ncbi:cell division protein FtsA [Candidatus Saccharibacteria bacterium CG11_big_fil_rev_8_21_14_0_20_41_19]|nr:MAG: cell division protein FtsA [Candidatus Saccharibacteria bacterium CG11_big_fil_rev_8_21_14_0_20_41_19]PIZ60718.1 MAG: cell division protein FtsA [Candidatus Saccharibacteria bacterium CG_4_10_14_0_2_um_filter_41_11]PJC29573.1 MAG: cell division protein FtsA [Candidatus Saccharibacteria bacterium CG_4_9_14_0_2_um_filter_41_9]PJE65767.1 MAG: cell division protein FtsA [Candidatus Saccharibacteria bacterium CG10_big_fil_rev_8_21_14_0_10_41_32]
MHMQEASSKYAVGIDIGTTTVRCVVGHIDGATGATTIVGVGVAANSGMRKGTVVNLTGPAQAIDMALGEAERMSGYQVDGATISINGSHILSTHTDGMIAVGGNSHEITEEDLIRIEEVATLGKVPANREVLEVIPHSYKLDGQDNIKNPIGMNGTRLEIDAHVVSVLVPHIMNLQKAVETAKVALHSIVIAGVAAARAVLTEQQIENGVVLIDIGGATTNVAIYEEGDLRFTSVIPIGGINITNDLAIGLKTDPEIAEKIKLEHASAMSRGDASGISIKHNDEIYSFNTNDIDEIVEARLEEIFEAINHELKRAGRAGKLPSGAVLTGGTAQLKNISEYAKESLGLAVRIGAATGYAGVADGVDQPQFATVIGLMLIDAETGGMSKHSVKQKGDNMLSHGMGIITKLLGRFRA